MIKDLDDFYNFTRFILIITVALFIFGGTLLYIINNDYDKQFEIISQAITDWEENISQEIKESSERIIAFSDSLRAQRPSDKR